MRQLTDSFLIEVLKLCFTKRTFLEICREHLKYQFIPTERSDVKIIYKSCLDYFGNTRELPTIGLISQQHDNKPEVQETLSRIRDISIPDSEGIIIELQNYIKRVRFQILNEQVVDLFNQEKYDEAIQVNVEESSKINDFSITKDTSYFVRVMKDFPTKMDSIRIQTEEERFKEKVPFNIPPLDAITYGGIEEAETVLFIAQSGVGKSTVLKWIGLSAARLKYRVLHIQLEGSEEECFLKYSQMWTAVSYHSLRGSNIDEKSMEDFYKKADMFKMKGSDVLIHAFEQLEEASVLNIKNAIELFQKEEGELPEIVILDSLDLCHPGDGLKYGYDTQSVKMRLNNTAKRLKNMCMEFGKIRLITATQTGDVSPEKTNDPTFVLTRHNTEGDRTLIKSFSYVFTLNQTDEEYKNDSLRIHVDKLRHYKSRQTYKVFTSYGSGRFLDIKRTKKLYEES